jgi:hypothetical protein
MNNNQLNFAYKVRHALNESLDNLPPSTEERLASARKMALSAKKNGAQKRRLVTQAKFAGNLGNYFNGHFSLIARLGMVVPAIILVTGLTAIYQFENQRHISDIAEIDALVLSDELPLSAYVDHGFNAYLAKQGE